MSHNKSRKSSFGVVNPEAIEAHNLRILLENRQSLNQKYEPITDVKPIVQGRTKAVMENYLLKAEEIVTQLESGDLKAKSFNEISRLIGASPKWLRNHLHFYNRVKAVFDRVRSPDVVEFEEIINDIKEEEIEMELTYFQQFKSDLDGWIATCGIENPIRNDFFKVFTVYKSTAYQRPDCRDYLQKIFPLSDAKAIGQKNRMVTRAAASKPVEVVAKPSVNANVLWLHEERDRIKAELAAVDLLISRWQGA